MSAIAGRPVLELEGLILNVLKTQNREMSAGDLVSAVVSLNQKYTDVDVKRAVWRMIAAHTLELSSNQLVNVLGRTRRTQRAVAAR